MSDQVVITPSGDLCVAIPLFRVHHEETLGKLEGYTISLTKPKPLAYVIDAGPGFGKPQMFNAEFVESACEFLGDL